MLGFSGLKRFVGQHHPKCFFAYAILQLLVANDSAMHVKMYDVVIALSMLLSDGSQVVF